MKKCKHRAWDTDQEKMTHCVSVYSESDDTECWWSADHIHPKTGDAISSFNGDTGVLMQYIGLKDFDGKEIYEDDFLQNPEGDMFRVIWRNGGFKFGRSWAFTAKEKASLCARKIFNKKLRVVGNRFKNFSFLNKRVLSQKWEIK